MATLNKHISRWNIAWSLIMLFVIYLPLAAMVLFSFNDSKRGATWRGFSLRHYEAAFADSVLQMAFSNSLLLAIGTAICATLLGLLVALSMERLPFPGSKHYLSVLSLPLVIPEICLGLALLIFFNSINLPSHIAWPFSLIPVLIAHTTFSLPFAALIIRARLRQLDRNYELAASDLGANTWYVFWHVILPQLRPALFASMLLTFTLSLDDFVISFFTSSPSAQLLPVKVFSMVRLGSTPVVNAISSILILLSLAAICSAIFFMRKK